jgi:hypothetical protein
VAIFASLFAVAGRFLGRFLTMALGWATILLFGRVPESKQVLLSFVSFASLGWIVVLLGVLIPDFGALLLTARTLPSFIEPYASLLMLVAALVIPLLVGAGTYLILDAADRPKGPAGIAKQVLRGFPYAAVLALTLAFLAVVAPLRKLRTMVKRWEDAHIPVVVKPGGYERVARDLEQALDGAGLGIDRRGAPRILEVPSKLLAAVAGPGVRRLVPDRLIVLGNRDLEVFIYPSDISVAGRKEQMSRARAAVASRLTFTEAYLTSSEDAQRIEDRLAAIVHAVPAVARTAHALASETATGDDAPPAGATEVSEVTKADPERLTKAVRDLADIDTDLARLVVAYDEWEVLYRLRLQVERDVLAARDLAIGESAHTAVQGLTATDTPTDDGGARLGGVSAILARHLGALRTRVGSALAGARTRLRREHGR